MPRAAPNPWRLVAVGATHWRHHLPTYVVRTMLRLHARAMATKATAVITEKPQLRRNAKRIHEAVAQTAIHSVAQSLARETPVRVLGLDINTNSTGYAVLDGQGRVVTWGHVTTTQFVSSDILAIAHAISDTLQSVHASSQDDTDVQWLVGIEDFMRMYRFGQFHNKGIFQLAQLNGIVSYTCWQRFGSLPVHTHPSAARGLFGIVAGKSARQAKKGEATVKEQVMQFVLAREQNSEATATLKRQHVNRFGQWTDGAYDIADAYVVASYTQWMALQAQLQQHPELLRQFSEAYLALVLPSTETDGKKKPKTVEATALLSMDAATKHGYLSELFAGGVVDWVKDYCQQHQHD